MSGPNAGVFAARNNRKLFMVDELGNLTREEVEGAREKLRALHPGAMIRATSYFVGPRSQYRRRWAVRAYVRGDA